MSMSWKRKKNKKGESGERRKRKTWRRTKVEGGQGIIRRKG